MFGEATFNLVINWVNNWGGWKQTAQSSHEIASHTALEKMNSANSNK